MPLLSQKGLLAIAAVIDVALQKDGQPVSAKTLAARHGLPPRNLELRLQELKRASILYGVRGPHGGYKLARDPHTVTVQDILCAGGAANEIDKESNSELVARVVVPILSAAEREFGQALTRISLDDMVQRAHENADSGADRKGSTCDERQDRPAQLKGNEILS